MEIKEYSVKEGIAFVLEMMSGKYVGQFMKSPSTGNVLLSKLAHGKKMSTVFYNTPEGIEFLQNIITNLAISVTSISVREEPQSKENSPFCFGEDYVTKFKTLGNTVKLSYIFQVIMGKTVRWQKMHLADKREPYYNKFSSEELQQINDAIRTIAINLASIKLVSDNK